MRNIAISLILLTVISCTNTNQTHKSDISMANITEVVQLETIDKLGQVYPSTAAEKISQGVKHAATLWRASDGTPEEFTSYCLENFIANADERELVFGKISKHLEVLYGHYNQIALGLNKTIHEPFGDIHAIDGAFGAYSASAHLIEDMYKNKVAFYVALNFPFYTLEEKNANAKTWTRLEWAYARLGDVFNSRIPANIKQNASTVSTESDMYISDYNIYAGMLVNDNEEKLFPEDMILLSHWNLRDEIKANYNKGDDGLAKQDMIYTVMQRIIDQSIPQEVINNGNYLWNPYTNTLTKDGIAVQGQHEANVRYQKLLDNFYALKAYDAYTPLNTEIKRAFEGTMEISQEQVETLFVEFLASDEVKQVGDIISARLGRELKPWDIWYDGFKIRSELDEDYLSQVCAYKYPNAQALNKDLPNLLTKLGFCNERAAYISDKIIVDPARGSGHAWGAQMKGDVAHLRTRIPEGGMDYKGYNIAIHEFGHNVEQTISLYDVDYYMLNGVPNTAFTEALAFIFQKRDLDLLGLKMKLSKQEEYEVLDNFWSTVEIMGVSILDQRTWKWMYEHPDASAEELKIAVIEMSKDIWNEFYAPVFGSQDEPILAVYSHMISYPLYLSNYAVGNLIEFQVEQHLKSADFASEVQEIYKQGRLTPNAWMQAAVNRDISPKAMLSETAKAINTITMNE